MRPSPPPPPRSRPGRPAASRRAADALDKIGTEILARREELGTLLSREEGKTRPEGIGEVTRAGQIFKFFAGECLRLSGEVLPSVRPGIGVEITREPIGVVGLITPWNFPIAIPAWKIAPALAYGNCVVLKPADIVPGCGVGAGRDHLAARASPPGVFNLVMGRGSVIGDALVRPSRRPRHQLHRLGRRRPSHRGGLRARATRRCSSRWAARTRRSCSTTPTSTKAVELSVQSAFYATGQRCTAASRLIVTEGIYPKFVDAIKARMAKLKVGDALAAGTDIGPCLEPEPARAGPGATSRSASARARRSPPAANG